MPISAEAGAPPTPASPATGASARTNAVWALLGQGGMALAQWLVVVVLARTSDPQVLGTYGLALAICTPVFAFWSLGLRNVYVAGWHTGAGLRPFLQLRSVGMTAALGCSLLAAMLLEPAGALVLLLVAAARAVDLVGDMIFGQDHARGRLRPVAMFQLANAAVSTSAVMVILLGGGSLVAALAAALAVSVVLSVVLPGWRLVRSRPRGPAAHAQGTSSLASLGSLWRAAVPLGIASVATATGTNVPRYALEVFADRADVGILSALSYVMLATTLIAAAVAQALLPVLSRMLHVSGVPAFLGVVRGAVVGALCVGLLLVALAFAAGRPVLRLLYGQQYADNWLAFGVLCLASALIAAGWIFDVALTAMGAFRRQLAANAVALGVVVVVAGPLVLLGGLLGAASAMVAFTLALCGARWLALRAAVRRR